MSGARTTGGTATLVVLIALVIGIIAAAAIFSVARGTQDVAEHGTTGIIAEATLSAAAASHNATSQAQVVAEAGDLGVAAAEDVTASLGRSREAIAELQERAGQLVDTIDDTQMRARVAGEVGTLSASATAILEAIETGDLERSLAAIETELHPAYDALVQTLAGVRNEAYAELDIAGNDAGRLADAARFVVVLVLPIAILFTFRNRVRRIQRRQELEAELEKEQAVSQTKSDFISHMSHQLRTPLTGIYGAAMELNDPAISANIPLSKELTIMITEESAELARMVEDILAVAAEDQGELTSKPQEIDPIAEINSVLEPFHIIGQATVRNLTPATVFADPRHFRQVISNLISNAHRYGSDPVGVRGFVDSDDYVVEVLDCGDGVPAEDEAKLFNRYVHEDDSPLITGRVGLGLSVAEILVTAMKGAIEYSRRSDLTVFTVRVPLAAPPS